MKKRSLKKIDILLFLLILYGPIKIFGIDPTRNPESSMRYILDINAYTEILIWFLIGIRVMMLSFKNLNAFFLIFTRKASLFYFLYGLTALISIIYSPAPLLTGFRAYQILICLLFINLLLLKDKTNNGESLLKITERFFLVITIYNFLMFFLAPEKVGSFSRLEGYRLIGGFIFNRDYGLASAITISFCLRRFSQNTKKNYFYCILYFLIALFVLIMSRTRSTIISIVLAIYIAYLLEGKFSKILSFAIGILTTVLLLYLSGYLNDLVLFIIRNPRTVKNMSLRTTAWQILWPRILERPLFGYGFAVGSRVLLAPLWKSAINIGSAHNSWLEALVSVGFWGTAMLAFSLIYGFVDLQKMRKTTSRSIRFQLNIWLLTLFFLSLGSEILSYLSPLYILIILYPSLILKNKKMSTSRSGKAFLAEG